MRIGKRLRRLRPPRIRVNEAIRIPEVFLIDENSKAVGVVKIEEARRRAEEAGLDLVEVNPGQRPPLCKILDFGKYKYEKAKAERESRKKQKQIDTKEIRMRVNIDKHDLRVKEERAEEFLKKGHRIKVSVIFRGREIIHTDRGHELLGNFQNGLREKYEIIEPLRRQGRQLFLVIGPGK